VDDEKEKLLELLTGHEGIKTVKEDHDLMIATLTKDITAAEINSYLFNKGVVLTHLVKRKPSLEQQFLTLTNNKN
jgi:ABC-2 type transport system ATP-binding protein